VTAAVMGATPDSAEGEMSTALTPWERGGDLMGFGFGWPNVEGRAGKGNQREREKKGFVDHGWLAYPPQNADDYLLERHLVKMENCSRDAYGVVGRASMRLRLLTQ
jgi:hypothetical protein